MNALLEKIFKKRGIKDASELSRDEKETFSLYQKILSKKEMTLGDLKEFISARIGQIEMKWQDNNTEAAKKAELIPYHSVYKMILAAIDAPQMERDALERALLAQLDI